MLLQSSLPCDTSHQQQPPRARLQIATGSLVASPPASPPFLTIQPSAMPAPTSTSATVSSSPSPPPPPPPSVSDIYTACRSLQSFMGFGRADNSGAPIAAPTTPDRYDAATLSMLTPPMSHAAPPLKLRLRSRGSNSALRTDLPRMKITKRALPRGVNKRRRLVDDEMGRDDAVAGPADDEGGFNATSEPDSDVDAREPHTPATPEPAAASEVREQEEEEEEEESFAEPATPKRSRIAPDSVPLGLDRADFHDLFVMLGGPSEDSESPPGTDVDFEADGSKWTVEDDKILVELVLEKLKLSKTEWQDCARALGKDRKSLGRRWKTLVASGDVGIKAARTSRRSRLHSTWR